MSETNSTDFVLYVRFPRRLNKDPEILKKQLIEMCPLICEVKRPRQPRTMFCFVYFKTQEDLEKGKVILENIELFHIKLKTSIPAFKDIEFAEKRLKEIHERRDAKNITKQLKKDQKFFGQKKRPGNLISNKSLNIKKKKDQQFREPKFQKQKKKNTAV